MSATESASQPPHAPLTDAIARHRKVFWCILIGVYAFAFNGQWRIGKDSALYRGLAHSLASGRGYTFGEFGSRQVYPGLPVLLAGLEKCFSLAAWPGIVVMHLMALGCLIFTYKLIRLRFPEWLAVIVTFTVGMNGWFLELTNELLTDIPFLLGVLIALYGWERLRITLLDQTTDDSRSPKRIVKPLIYLFVGLALAAVMRPTFLVLAMAWVLVCVWGLLAGPKRGFYFLCLAILFIVWLGVALTDPRVRGFKPLQGGYEQDALNSLRQAAQNIRKNFPELTGTEMNFSFFGEKWWPPGISVRRHYIPGMTDIMSVVVILSALLLWRVNPLWTLLVFLTIAVTLVMTVVPRYYMMILPLLTLAWFLLILEIARRVPGRWFETVLLAGILIVVLMNFARSIKVIGEQRSWNNNNEDAGPKYQAILDISPDVNKLVPPGEMVIAPDASVMAFASDRECVMARDILPTNKSPVHYPEHLAALNIHYAIFPSRLYQKSDRIIRELMDRGVIVPTGRIGKEGDMVLATVEIKLPPPGVNWRTQPIIATLTAKTTVSGTTRPTTRVLAAKKRQSAKVAAQRKEKARKNIEKKKRQERQVAATRAAAKKRRRAAATSNITTPPATTTPTSGPITAPSSSPSP